MNKYLIVFMMLAFTACATTSVETPIEKQTVCEKFVEKFCADSKPYACMYLDHQVDRTLHTFPEMAEKNCTALLGSPKRYELFRKNLIRTLLTR